MRTLHSKFSSEIMDFFAYRQAFGYKEISYQQLFPFDAFCCSHFPNESILTKELVWEWAQLKPGESHASRYSRVSAVRLFAKYLNAIGREAYVIPDGLFSEKRNFTPYIFTDSELTALFRSADLAPTLSLHSYRSQAVSVIFRLIYSCGLRPGEARLLPCKNVNLENGEILIQKTKYNKERIVVMSAETLELCRNYAFVQKLSALNQEYFFPNAFGTPFTSEQLRHIFRWCWKMANPQMPPEALPRVRSYDLRHRFASTVLLKWLNEGADMRTMLPYLQIYMGHDSLESTAYYIHLLPENLLKGTAVKWAELSDLIPEVSAWQK